MQEGDIPSIELNEVEKYRKRKVMNAKKQRKELLEKRRKEVKEDSYEELQAVQVSRVPVQFKA